MTSTLFTSYWIRGCAAGWDAIAANHPATTPLSSVTELAHTAGFNKTREHTHMPAVPAWPMPNKELAQTHNTVIYQGNAGVLVNPINWDSTSGMDYNEVRVGL